MKPNLSETAAGTAAAPTPTATANAKRSISERWAESFKNNGYVPVINYFLEHYHELQPYDLTHGEAMFVIHLMQFKWGTAAPYPGYKLIGKRMGVTHKTARRFAQSLEQKGYLIREMQKAQTNKFHLNGLIQALAAHQKANPKKRAN